ncbi:uncharacterized protein [Amphiura filiformis]|uniref:uncharacterized protein n=1 Tax=Amphiura filiformis TaxID=82378 RepID=UPI003B22706E
MATLEEVKADLDEALQYLKTCDDFTTPEVQHALSTIEISAFSDDSVKDKIQLYLVSHGYAQLFVRMWSGLSEFLEKEKWEDDGFSMLEAMVRSYLNCTDGSPELCVELGKCGSISMLFSGLNKLEMYFEEGDEFESIAHFVQTILFLLCNCISRSSSNRKIYQEANAVAIFKKYLKSQTVLVSLLSLMILAYVVNDSESAILATLDGGVAILVQWLQEAVNASEHCASRDSIVGCAREILDCLNHLASNDNNKLEIERQGGIPTIVRMLQDDFDEEDQCVAAETVWNLAFVESIRTSPQLQKSVPLLNKLRRSTNRNLRKTSGIAYWEINDNRPEDLPIRESTPQEPPPAYEASMKEPKRPAANTAKLMISYQWDFQDIALKIRDDLVNNGHRVWMDLTHLRDDILNSMADAVEKSEIVLIFMSEAYKNSQNCRTEAEYAYKKKKKVIPLLVEQGYDPDGWLGALQGTKLYYKFFTGDLRKTDMAKLLTALREQSTNAQDELDGPIIATEANNDHAAAPSPNSKSPVSQNSKSPVSNWSAKDVQGWLKRENLGDQTCCLSIKRNKQNLCDTLHGLDGNHLEKMYQEYSRDPNKFKDEMRSEWQMKGKVYLKFTVALTNLFEK